MFIDDIKKCILNSKFELYADDLKLSRTVLNSADQVRLQEDLDRVAEWCKLNHMSLNTNKCCHIKFSRKHNKFPSRYSINGAILKRVDQVRDLGVALDSEMKFTIHVNNTINKCLRMLAFLFRNTKEFNSVQAMKVLYYSLVRSHVDYCGFVWYPYYQNNIQRIERIQRKFVGKISFINGTYRSIKSYSGRLDRFNMPSLRQRNVQLSMIFLYKLFNNEVDCPSLLTQMSMFVPRTAARLHNYKPFAINLRKNKYGSCSPICTILKNYNYIFQGKDLDINFVNFINFKKSISESCKEYF